MANLFRSFVNELKEYTPGKNPEKQGIIKLASNENPFGPSPKAVAAIVKESKNLERYPDQKSNLLRQAISKKLGVSADSIICGNGSDDIMQIAGATFLSPGEEVIIARNSFSVYGLVAKIFEGRPVFVGLKDYQVDLPSIAKAVTPKTKMVFLTNPHNPCGTIFTSKDLDGFIGAIPENVLIIVDEAYCEFVESGEFPDTIKRIKDGRKNLLVLRTFSKFYGLAGLRIGYGIAAPNLTAAMMKVKMPFNVNRLAQTGAAAALDDASFLKKTYKNNAEGKKQLYQGLGKLGLDYKKTEANFVFINTNQNADELFLKLMAKGIIIRPLTSFDFPQAVRVSVGTKDQNEKFISVLELCF